MLLALIDNLLELSVGCMPCLAIGTALLRQVATGPVTVKTLGTSRCHFDKAEQLLESLQAAAVKHGKTSPEYLSALSSYIEHCARLGDAGSRGSTNIIEQLKQAVPAALERQLSRPMWGRCAVVKLTGKSRVSGSWPMRFVEYEIEVSTADNSQLFWRRYSEIETLANKILSLIHI